MNINLLILIASSSSFIHLIILGDRVPTLWRGSLVDQQLSGPLLATLQCSVIHEIDVECGLLGTPINTKDPLRQNRVRQIHPVLGFLHETLGKGLTANVKARAMSLCSVCRKLNRPP